MIGHFPLDLMKINNRVEHDLTCKIWDSLSFSIFSKVFIKSEDGKNMLNWILS